MSSEYKYLIAVVVSGILAAWAAWSIVQDLRWEEYRKQHHCQLISEERRSAIPLIPNKQIWNCEGKRVER